jgi:eight-cysteine-cluster-containing protein
MIRTKIFWFIGLIVLLSIAIIEIVWGTKNTTEEVVKVTNFEECVFSGGIIREIYPRQCQLEDGSLFDETITEVIPIEQGGLEERTPEPMLPVQVPVQPPVSAVKECKKTGCSGELCVDANLDDFLTLCVYLDEYDCYKLTKCEVQTNGECGWTATEEFTKCMDNYR